MKKLILCAAFIYMHYSVFLNYIIIIIINVNIQINPLY